MPQSMIFGDLVLQFTCQFAPRWNDHGSRGKFDGSFWQPVPPDGFKALGSIGVEGYVDPTNTAAALCVAEARPGSGALRPPDDYILVWADHRSGAHQDGSCWRPIPHGGYVALGDVFVRGYDKPSLDDAVCVRADLVSDGTSTAWVWQDKHTHAKKDFTAWQVSAPAQYVDATRGMIAVNSFVGVESHDERPSSVLLRCLCLPLPAEKFDAPGPPVLTSRSKPDETTVPAVDRIVWVPFTAVHDPEGMSLSWRVQNSPFYQLQRLVGYKQLMHDDNRTPKRREQIQYDKFGVSTSQSRAFSITTGVSVTAEAGVSLGAGGTVSATVSVKLGWATSTGIEQFEEAGGNVEMSTPPNTACALWAKSYALRLLRLDGKLIPVTPHLDFLVTRFYDTQFPASQVEGQPPALFSELPPIAVHVPT